MCGYGEHWRQLSLACRQRDNWTCQKCGAKPQSRAERRNFHADHIQPRERGGADTLANLQTLCWHCHCRKTMSGKSVRKARQIERVFRANALPPRPVKQLPGRKRTFKTKALVPYQPRW